MNRVMYILFTIFFFACMSFSGCVKYYELLPSEIPQASVKKVARSHISNAIRDVQFYHEFSTEALFNVLWKSPTNGNIILDMYADRRGLSLKRKQAIIEKNKRMHAQSICFFVLAYVKDQQRTDLHDGDATWTLYLQTKQGDKIAPTKIKPMDMTPELATIFEKRNTNFKQLYFVKFPRKYVKNNGIILEQSKQKEMTDLEVIESIDNEEQVNVTKKDIIKEEIMYDIYDEEILTLVINSVELEEKISWAISPDLAETFDVKNALVPIKESDSNEDCDWL